MDQTTSNAAFSMMKLQWQMKKVFLVLKICYEIPTYVAIDKCFHIADLVVSLWMPSLWWEVSSSIYLFSIFCYMSMTIINAMWSKKTWYIFLDQMGDFEVQHHRNFDKSFNPCICIFLKFGKIQTNYLVQVAVHLTS